MLGVDCEILGNLVWLELFFRKWDQVVKLFIYSQGTAERETQRVGGASSGLQDVIPFLANTFFKISRIFYLDYKTLDGGTPFFITGSVSTWIQGESVIQELEAERTLMLKDHWS